MAQMQYSNISQNSNEIINILTNPLNCEYEQIIDDINDKKEKTHIYKINKNIMCECIICQCDTNKCNVVKISKTCNCTYDVCTLCLFEHIKHKIFSKCFFCNKEINIKKTYYNTTGEIYNGKDIVKKK